MKKTWRWPLAGFVLGGLVGATFLTVNVVGASSPNAPAVPSRGSFGEILHTPPLLARVGKAVELSLRRGLRRRRRRARREMHATRLGVRAGSGRDAISTSCRWSAEPADCFPPSSRRRG